MYHKIYRIEVEYRISRIKNTAEYQTSKTEYQVHDMNKKTLEAFLSGCWGAGYRQRERVQLRHHTLSLSPSL